MALTILCGCSSTSKIDRQALPISGGSNDSSDPVSDVVVKVWGSGGYCTGTFITPTAVLTASHCMLGTDKPSNPVGNPIQIWVGADINNPIRKYYWQGPSVVAIYGGQSIHHVDDSGNDLAIIFLDNEVVPQGFNTVPAFDYAAIHRPTLIAPCSSNSSVCPDTNGGPYSPPLIMAGWSAAGNPQFRQVVTIPDDVNHYPGSPEPDGQYWDHHQSSVFTQHGDSGGPLFVMNQDAAGQPFRDVLGVLSNIHTSWCCNYDQWTDITRGAMAQWMNDVMTDKTRTDKWHQQHPGYKWWGEVDYTGPCRADVDSDCDHWLDVHDNCPQVYNPDQADGLDVGVGNACLPVITSITPTHGPKEGETPFVITGFGFPTDIPATITFNNIFALDAKCPLSTMCTGKTPQNGGATGKVLLSGTVKVQAWGNNELHGVTTTYTYDPSPAPPSCTSTMACPPSYGALDMTVSCTDNHGPLAVDYYLYDAFTGNLSAYPGNPSSSQTAVTTTYPTDYVVACPAGLDTAWLKQSCSFFSTYQPQSTYCGSQTGNPCRKGTHWCGDDEGCQRVCT
jgi:hypothetical protein